MNTLHSSKGNGSARVHSSGVQESAQSSRGIPFLSCENRVHHVERLGTQGHSYLEP
jgi:hypothetical protein